MRAPTATLGHVLRRAARVILGVADRLEPHPRRPPRRHIAPLVRLGGRWWRPDELAAVPVEEGCTEPDGRRLP